MSQGRAAVITAVLGCQAPAYNAEASTEKGTCNFNNEPVGVGSFWDPTCDFGMLGCNADGKNLECRYCGAGEYLSIDCPTSSCHFQNEPVVPYYWDKDCEAGKLGCWADGIHAQCRFCGDHPFTSTHCPDGSAPPKAAGCAFENEPVTPYYWEPGCEEGKFGCLADGQHVNCRFCGAGHYEEIPCPASQVCSFANEPLVPYFWDPSCKDGGLGCNADGIHQECRYCALRPFEEVPCPTRVAPPKDRCAWPLKGEPLVPYFWDRTCKMGELGCWADGMNAACRLCGEGVFANISCPEAALQDQSAAASKGSNEASKAEGSKAAPALFAQSVQQRSAPAHDYKPASWDEEPLDVELSAAAPLIGNLALAVFAVMSFFA